MTVASGGGGGIGVMEEEIKAEVRPSDRPSQHGHICAVAVAVAVAAAVLFVLKGLSSEKTQEDTLISVFVFLLRYDSSQSGKCHVFVSCLYT